MRVTFTSKDIKNAVKAIKPFVSKDLSQVESCVLFNIAENGDTLILRYGNYFIKKAYLELTEAWGDANDITRFNGLCLNIPLNNLEALTKNASGEVSIVWDIKSVEEDFTEYAERARIINNGRESIVTSYFVASAFDYLEVWDKTEILHSIKVKYNRNKVSAMTYFADLQKFILRDINGLEAFDMDLGDTDFSYIINYYNGEVSKSIINRGFDILRKDDGSYCINLAGESIQKLSVEKNFELYRQFIHCGEYDFKISAESLKDIKKMLGKFSKEYGIIYYSEELEGLVYSERCAYDGSMFEIGIDMQGDWDKENYLALSIMNFKALVESGGEFNYSAEETKIYTRAGALVKRLNNSIIHFTEIANPYYVASDKREADNIVKELVSEVDTAFRNADVPPLIRAESYADIIREFNKRSAYSTSVANDYDKLCKMFGEYAKGFEIQGGGVYFGDYRVCLRQSMDLYKEALTLCATLYAMIGEGVLNGLNTDALGINFNVVDKNYKLVKLSIRIFNEIYTLYRNDRSVEAGMDKDALLEKLQGIINRVNKGGDEFVESFNKHFDKFISVEVENKELKVENPLGESEPLAETFSVAESVAEVEVDTETFSVADTEINNIAGAEAKAETQEAVKYSDVDIEKLSEFVVDCYNNLNDGLSYKAYKEAWASIDWGVSMGAKAIIEMICYKYKNHAVALQNIIKGYTDMESKCYDYTMWEQCMNITHRLIVAMAEVFLNFLETEAETESPCYVTTHYTSSSTEKELGLVEKTTMLLNSLKIERVLGFIRGNTSPYNMEYAYG